MWETIDDDYLAELRELPKYKVAGTRLKPKTSQFLEQQFELESETPGIKFRLYRRHHVSNPAVFSVGLQAHVDDHWLTLCRYNGPYHPHRNHLDKSRLVGVAHIHTATAAYMREAPHPDGFAEATSRYTDVESAFSCIIADCNILGIKPRSELDDEDDDPNLTFDFE